jgi:rubrerythrin
MCCAELSNDKTMDNTEAGMNIFDFALKMEADGKEYYEKLAKETSIPEFKSIFTLLAVAEQVHHEAIQAMKNCADAVQADSKVLSQAKNIFEKLLKMNETHDTLQFDRDGYLHAVRAEEVSIKFYEEAAKNENNENARNLLLMLARDEKEHLSIVENIYEFVEKPRTFLAWGEFSNLKEL